MPNSMSCITAPTSPRPVRRSCWQSVTHRHSRSLKSRRWPRVEVVVVVVVVVVVDVGCGLVYIVCCRSLVPLFVAGSFCCVFADSPASRCRSRLLCAVVQDLFQEHVERSTAGKGCECYSLRHDSCQLKSFVSPTQQATGSKQCNKNVA